MAVNRYYSSTAVDTTVASSVVAGDTTIVVTSTTGFPTSYPYTLALDYDTSKEELINVVGASGTTLTVGVTVGVASTSGRGVDGTTAQTHSVGANVKHVISGRDMREAQEHIAASTSVHGITDTTALVTKTGYETLTNKTLTSPAIANGTLSGTLTSTATISGGSITGPTITNPAIAGGSITGTITGNPTFTGTVVLPSTTTVGSVSATELAYVDGVTSAIQTQLDAKAPLASPTFTGTVTLPTGVTGATGAITSSMIADGTIVDADINASAAIVATKLTGTTAEFNAALSDNNFATISGIENLVYKTLEQPIYYQSSPFTSATATLTLGASDLDKRVLIYNGTSTANHTWTLPSGSALDSYFTRMTSNTSFDFCVIDTNPSGTAGLLTIAVGTGITAYGVRTVFPADTGALFRLHKNTGSATWSLYRLA